jgi:putative ABC transport system ATP-binding protein
VIKRWAGEHGFLLNVPELVIRKGEKVALVGFSGCGKSTLLDLLALVLRPDSAREFAFFALGGEPMDVTGAWSRKDLNGLARARMQHMGYVLQTGGLLPFLTVRDNIGLIRRGLGLPVENAVESVADRLGIGRQLEKLPGRLSVGERQRVAIARAMAHEPSVVIADEPTASLDPINSEQIMDMFTSLADEYGATLVLATHEWGQVEKRGFRHVRFRFDQGEKDGTVRAEVSG